MQLFDPATRTLFEHALEAARRSYCFCVIGYVVMPEHIHLLVSEPERETLAVAMQAMKQSVSRQRVKVGGHFWQPRYYDFNVWSEKKRIEKLRYIHRNPVRRGLVKNPEDWQWSSYRHYRGPRRARFWGVGAADGGSGCRRDRIPMDGARGNVWVGDQ